MNSLKLMKYRIASLAAMLVICFCSWTLVLGQNVTELPQPSNPPRLVNDFGQMMSPTQQDNLERLLLNFEQTSSTQIAIVTVNNLDGHEAADYAISLFNKWRIGQKGKNNGVLIFAAKEDRKMWITTGQGLEGALTDAQSGMIVRNEMRPAFQTGDYYNGFLKAAEAVVAATKGEYVNDKTKEPQAPNGIFFVVFIIIVIIIITALKGGGGKGGNGRYMSRRGSDFLTGAILGSLLNGGRGSSGGGWGGDSGGFGGGGFGGFGGGYSGGGGAGGSW
jgi:uncharacterized protein